MDLYGRRWVAVPCTLILGLSFVLMTSTRSALTLTLVAMLMGFGNGIGSGIVMTLSADVSPEIGRPTFLGLWRELSDTGQGVGPLLLSGVTAVAGLAAGIVVSGFVGFAAAGVLWVFIPRRAPGVALGRGGEGEPRDDLLAGGVQLLPVGDNPAAQGRLARVQQMTTRIAGATLLALTAVVRCTGQRVVMPRGVRVPKRKRGLDRDERHMYFHCNETSNLS